MVPILTLLVVILMSILVTRVATIALTHTGLTRASAKFQARSAFSGAGFTTSESEMVVNHPVRRRIVMILILLGNAGLVTAVSSLILTFVRQGDSTSLPIRVVMLVGGLVVLWAFASSRWVDRRLSWVIDRLLNRYTDLNVTDYASLLHLTGEYRLAELKINRGDWLDGKSLGEARLREEGINVLGIEGRDGTYIGNLAGETTLHENDTLVLYGNIDDIKALDKRGKGYWGDREHREAVRDRKKELEGKTDKGYDEKTGGMLENK